MGYRHGTKAYGLFGLSVSALEPYLSPHAGNGVDHQPYLMHRYYSRSNNFYILPSSCHQGDIMNVYSFVLIICGLVIWMFSEVYEPLKYLGVALIIVAFFLPMIYSAFKGTRYSG